jgi:hypothetical protein
VKRADQKRNALAARRARRAFEDVILPNAHALLSTPAGLDRVEPTAETTANKALSL